MYECGTCGALAAGVKAARRHAKQGHRTQRDAYAAGELHSLSLVVKAAEPVDDVAPVDYAGTIWNSATVNGWDAADLGGAHAFYGPGLTVTVHYEAETMIAASVDVGGTAHAFPDAGALVDYLIAGPVDDVAQCGTFGHERDADGRCEVCGQP